MNDSIILHHYEGSPYAEKIRLMFGLANTPWNSILTSVQPPRPSLDPLTGGYRRIPVAQLGADIFCDTAIIVREVANLTNNPALDPTSIDATSLALMEQAEKETFFAAIGAVKPLRLLSTLVLQLGPIGMYRAAKDRAGILKGGTVRPPRGEAKAKEVLDSMITALEKRLEDNLWVDGDSVSIADFTVYHPLWLNVSFNRRELKAGPKVIDWYKRVTGIGHGQRKEITQDQAFTIARDSEPRVLPDSVKDLKVPIGTMVDVAPSDYGIRPVTGKLAAMTENRIILTRDNTEFGTLNVHFPRSGYSLVSR